MKKTLTKVRNTLLHILFLAALFVGSVLFFMRMINHVQPDTAQTMDQSTFPLVSMVRGGVSFNCMHGYAREMDVRYLRDSVTPLRSDRQIGIQIQTFSATIEAISYEVLTRDGAKSLENTQVVKTQQDHDYITATLQLQNQLLMDQEYVLKLKLTSAGRDIYYYTHVLLADGLHTDEYLNFVTGFYEKTVNRTDLTSVGAAVEPDETTDQEGSLAHMDIHDSVPQLTWGELRPQVYYKPTPQIVQINRNTATVNMDYRIASVNEEGITEVFNVRESYRVRFTDSRVFLLNFERTTDEVFDPENHVLESTGIRLGITGKDVEYAADERGRVVAFVQENELWTYEKSTSKLTQIFSFPQKENMDSRDFYDAHKIRILRVSSQGDVYFTVSGYMNRGEHEGDNGILLCRYEAATDMVEERVFLQCSMTGKQLWDDVDTLAYVSGDGTYFCVLVEQTLYRVDLTTLACETLADGILYNCRAGSASGRYFAYLSEGEEYGSSQITVMDLEEGRSDTITCGADEKLRPVCYFNDDLVYGVAKDTDIEAGTFEMGYFPMYRMEIVDGEGNVIKTYEPGGSYVMKVEQADHMLSLTRAIRDSAGSFLTTSPDEIVDMASTDTASMGSATKQTERKQTVVYLRVGAEITDTSPDVVRSKVIKYVTPRTALLPSLTQRQQLCYVYAAGHLSDIYVRSAAAVMAADSELGYVLDTDQDYLWIRGNRETTAQIQLDKVPEVMKGGVTDAAQLSGAVDGKVLDLKGCSLDEILYYVSHGCPVAADTPDGPVTIVGYDEYNTYLLNPGEQEWYYYGMNDSTELFARAGNHFLTCLPG